MDHICMKNNLGDVSVNEHKSTLDIEKDVVWTTIRECGESINDTKSVMLIQQGPIRIFKKNDVFVK